MKLNEINYDKIFSPETLKSLKGKSGESLRQMTGDKNLMQSMIRSSQLTGKISQAEKGHEDELARKAVKMVKKAYPIIDYAGIEIDAKIESNVSLDEDTSKQMKRRIINGITQGSSVRGAFAFYLFRDAIGDISDEVVDNYGEILKLSFGTYDDDNAVSLMLSQLATNPNAKPVGGTSKVEHDKETGKLKIIARAVNFPMLVHEIIKGLYEILSLQGFTGDEKTNQNTVNTVDKLENEPDDLRYGKFIYDAINALYIDSNIDDSRVRELFFAELYKLPETEFLEFVENAINEKLNTDQKNWALREMKSIEKDLKADDSDEYLTEIKPTIGGRVGKITVNLINTKYVDSYKPIFSDSILNSISWLYTKGGPYWGENIYSYKMARELSPSKLESILNRLKFLGIPYNPLYIPEERIQINKPSEYFNIIEPTNDKLTEIKPISSKPTFITKSKSILMDSHGGTLLDAEASWWIKDDVLFINSNDKLNDYLKLHKIPIISYTTGINPLIKIEKASKYFNLDKSTVNEIKPVAGGKPKVIAKIQDDLPNYKFLFLSIPSISITNLPMHYYKDDGFVLSIPYSRQDDPNWDDKEKFLGYLKSRNIPVVGDPDFVANRNIIENPEKYFDIQFISKNDNINEIKPVNQKPKLIFNTTDKSGTIFKTGTVNIPDINFISSDNSEILIDPDVTYLIIGLKDEFDYETTNKLCKFLDKFNTPHEKLYSEESKDPSDGQKLISDIAIDNIKKYFDVKFVD